MKKLPIGITSLEKIRRDNYIYVDKTQYVASLANLGGRYYFLSRPRRFGKSLFLDTIKQAFLGRKDLFDGLYLENNWDWDNKYPVIHFSFGVSSGLENSEVVLDIIWQTMLDYANVYNVELKQGATYTIVFQQLIRDIANSCQCQVVILIDEYDKPILDCINDIIQVEAVSEILKGLYSVIKENDSYLKFVLLTGVSVFSKVSLFSGLNILEDISLNKKYADICGYTQDDLELEFDEYLQAGNVDTNELEIWYKGYNFTVDSNQSIYNPFDILLFFNTNYEYRNYWFETTDPKFIVTLLLKRHYFIPNLEKLVVSDSQLLSFDITNIGLATLLYQTGYLTIKRTFKRGRQLAYELSYPNYEVKHSLNNVIAEIGTTPENKELVINQLYTTLKASNWVQFKKILTNHFASLSPDWCIKHDIANYQGFYASIVYSFLSILGYELVAEDISHQSKIDLTLITPEKILIIEFKLSQHGSAKQSIELVKSKGYPQKYKSTEKPIYLIGITFNPEKIITSLEQ